MSTPRIPPRRPSRFLATAALTLGGLITAGWVLGAVASGQPAGAPGSVAAGRVVYEQQCARCHGGALEGVGRFPPLVGRHTVPDYPTAGVLYEYTRRSMPYNAPGTLSDEDTLSVVAFMLHQNGLWSEDAVLTFKMLEALLLPGADPIAPDLPNAPAEPQQVTPGSSQAGPVIP